MSSLTELQLNRQLYRTQPQTVETLGADTVASNASASPSTALASGNSVTDVNTNAEQINGAAIEPGTIPAETLDVSNWGWTQTCAFTSASATQVNWGSGSFVSANGVTYAISAGNTGTMSTKTYIYLDLNVANNAYQHTTTSANAVGVGKVLVAVAQNGASTATFNLNVATQIVGDNILANTINASKIETGTLTADMIAAGTMTGSTVRTSSGTTRVEMSNSDNSLALYDSGVLRAKLKTLALSFYDSTGTFSGRVYGGTSEALLFNLGTGTDLYSMEISAFLPPGGADLGGPTAGTMWNNIYASMLYSDVSATNVSVTNINGSAIQFAADTISLGDGNNCDITIPLGALTLTAGQMYFDNGSINLTAGFANLAQMSGSTAEARGDYRDGSIYYRTDDNVIRVRLNGAWKTITTS